MAGWEEELAVLLGELGVMQEESRTHLRPTRFSETKLHKFPLRSDTNRREQAADALSWQEHGRNIHDENDDAWLTDLSLMRREVDSIVTQVMRLLQRGDIDKSLKEDVMVIFRALRRRATVTQQAALSDEAYLEYASSMLHFCRLVLRLSEISTDEQ